MKSYYVYKTTDSRNGNIYIGVHYGELDDNYYGSGNIIKSIINKHGTGVFARDNAYLEYNVRVS